MACLADGSVFIEIEPWAEGGDGEVAVTARQQLDDGVEMLPRQIPV